MSQYKAWYELYRPREIQDLIFPNVLNGENKDADHIKKIFTKFYDEEFVRGNVLSYGPGGFGKQLSIKYFKERLLSILEIFL